jgi:hypothetical protein
MTDPDNSKVNERVENSLAGTPYEPSELTQISGGSVNFTYVATLAKPLDDGTKKVFVKHSEPWMKAKPDTALTMDRVVSSSAASR